MFGYHDSPKCNFDIWSPNPTRWGDNAIENRAFSAFCMHTSELDSFVDQIVTALQENESDINIGSLSDFTTSDLEYIQMRLNKLGYAVSLTLN